MPDVLPLMPALSAALLDARASEVVHVAA
jgi:hypothetical protein